MARRIQSIKHEITLYADHYTCACGVRGNGGGLGVGRGARMHLSKSGRKLGPRLPPSDGPHIEEHW